MFPCSVEEALLKHVKGKLGSFNEKYRFGQLSWTMPIVLWNQNMKNTAESKMNYSWTVITGFRALSRCIVLDDFDENILGSSTQIIMLMELDTMYVS